MNTAKELIDFIHSLPESKIKLKGQAFQTIDLKVLAEYASVNEFSSATEVFNSFLNSVPKFLRMLVVKTLIGIKPPENVMNELLILALIIGKEND